MLRFELTNYAVDRGYNNDALGWLPMLLDARDQRPASEQLAENYAHGGGWHPFDGFQMRESDHALVYPAGEDGPAEIYRPLATARLHHEQLYFYESEWLAVVQPDGSYAVNRMD